MHQTFFLHVNMFYYSYKSLYRHTNLLLPFDERTKLNQQIYLHIYGVRPEPCCRPEKNVHQTFLLNTVEVFVNVTRLSAGLQR